MTIGLGIDSGGTSCRWALFDGASGAVLGEGKSAPIPGHVYTPETKAKAALAIEELAAAVLRAGKPAGVLAGMTGVDNLSDSSRHFCAAFARAFGADPARVSVVSDVDIAYRANFAPGEGYLVYAGTGAVGAFMNAQGETIAVGGRGELIDDAGAAHWIAMRAVRAILRAEDRAPGSGWATPLGEELARDMGATDWRGIRDVIYGHGRGAIGVLARAVGRAGQQGDAHALNIFAAAGVELATLAQSFIARFGPRPVVLTGGAPRLSPRIFESFAAQLPAECAARFTQNDAALAAARVAADQGT